MSDTQKTYHYAFVINPISGGIDKTHFANLLQSNLPIDNRNYTIQYTQSKGHAIQIAKNAASEADVVVAVGGDGTVHEVINGLFGSDVPMGIIPMGSGNGLARDLSIPMDVTDAIQNLIKGHVTRIDLGQVNEKIFTNSFSLGKVARVAREFDQMPIRGMTGYVLCVLRRMFESKPIKVHLDIDGKAQDTVAELLDVMNISEFGNHLKIAPQASATDGQLHLQIFYKFPWYRLPIWTFKAFLGRPIRSRYFHTTPFQTLRIRHQQQLAQFDGEPCTISPGTIEIRCLPHYFPIITPG